MFQPPVHTKTRPLKIDYVIQLGRVLKNIKVIWLSKLKQRGKFYYDSFNDS